MIDDLKDGFNTIDVSGENILAAPGYLIIAFTAEINDISQKKIGYISGKVRR